MTQIQPFNPLKTGMELGSSLLSGLRSHIEGHQQNRKRHVIGYVLAAEPARHEC